MDSAGGRVYVADSGNNRVNIFAEDGAFLSSFGSTGSGPGQLTNPRRVAVDNNPASPNFQDVYVADSNQRIQRFSSGGAFETVIGIGQLNRSNPPISVGPSGSLYAVDSTGGGPEIENRQVKIFSSAGALVGSSTIGSGSFGDAVVDSTATLYIIRTSAGGGIDKYELTEPTATSLEAFDPATNATALAVDEEDNFYVAQQDNALRRIVTKRDPTGAIVKRFGYGEIQFNLQGLAVGPTGFLFGSEEFVGNETEGNKVVRIPQPPPGPFPCCLDIEEGNTHATLKGQVNPEGKSTTYHFEYITDADFTANGNSFSGPKPATSTPESPPVGSDFVLYPAQAEIGCNVPIDPPQPECLEPETVYHVRLVAKNADGVSSPETTFETREPFEIKGTWSTDVGLGDAGIHAAINPLGIPASAFFEFVDDATFKAGGNSFNGATKVPATPIALGGGNTEVVASAALSGLSENTLYHYRVVVANFKKQEAGPVRTLRTFPTRSPIPDCANDSFRVDLSALLANCRAYEMVSPIDKNGGDIKVLVQGVSFPARLDQTSDAGDAFTYSAIASFAEPQSSLWSNQYFSRRGNGGWITQPINQPKEPTNLATNPILKLDTQYRMFSPDLGNGWLSQYANPQLDSCAPAGFINLYRRDNSSGDYEALVTKPPTNIAANPDYRLELQGVSADGTKAVFRANAKLTSTASGIVDLYQLYIHTRDPAGGCGELRLVSFKSTGTPMTENSSAGSPAGPAEYREAMVTRAVSVDGSRVFFSSNPNTPAALGPLYARVNADQVQSPVSGGKCTNAALGCTLQISAATAQFWTAAADGSRAIYSIGNELFEYDVDKALANQPASTLIADGAKGVVGASENASRIYFVSTEQIEGEGKAGKPNLYLYEPGNAAPERYRLVATLSDLDKGQFPLWGFGVGNSQPIRNGTRLSPDGSHLAFVSSKSLTGYDNLDADSGEPAIEVYLYDTASEQVRCVSCNPSGSRPQGREFKAGSVVRQVAAMMAPGESQTFAPRSLSADGNRLFFESFESLLPRDENEAMDVYEWQRSADAGECAAKGAELYVPTAGGCLSLISSGEAGATDSELADASPDGSDVFIRTASSLVPQDPGQVDVYDAREGGGFPAFVPIAPCVGEGCQPPPPPDPPQAALPTQGPSSGNVAAPKACPKGKVKNKKGKCVKKKAKKKSKAKKKKAGKNKKGGR